eukprot:scaffold43062_cov49-Phaeocystis_antarctica.AAC.2
MPGHRALPRGTAISLNASVRRRRRRACTRTPGRTVNRIEGRVALPGATDEQLVRVGQGARALPKRRGGGNEAG